jgi:hypothetical protein
MCDCRPNYDRIGHDQYAVPEDHTEEISQLKERVEILELALGIHKVTAPNPAKDQTGRDYRQPGVKW